MKTITLLSLISAAFIGFTQPMWAGPHGGSAGFDGGGGRAGPVGGGRGFHGGGFRGGAGPRFSSFGHPSDRQSVYSGRPSRTVTPSVRATTGASQPQNRFSSSGTAAQGGLNGRTDHIAERHDANWHGDWDRRHAHFDRGHFFVFVDGFWCGLDAGFFPWDYYPYYGYDYYPYDYYTADVPQYGNDNTEPDYNGAPVADPTVQAVQTQLTQQGYYNGPADGIFGPTTRDAVAKYQIAKNLNVTGSLSPDMLQSLGLPQATGS